LGGAHAKAIDEKVVKCFQFKWRSITQSQKNPDDKREYYSCNPETMLDLPISQDHLGREISGKFMKALRDFQQRQELTGSCQWKNPRKEMVDAIYYRQIVAPPPVLLVKIMRLGFSPSGCLVKIDRPMAIPLEFEMPEEMVASSDPRKYRLIGGVVHLGNAHGGHYIAYIKTSDGFFRFNDAQVQRLSDGEALEALKRGAYVLAYRREN
jgi:ubiquitin C-terminal hydrolase